MLGRNVSYRSETKRIKATAEPAGSSILPEQLFTRLLCLERKRTERSGRRFVLMLLDPGSLISNDKAPLVKKLLHALAQSIRDTDIKGWYKDRAVIGVIFTEVGNAEEKLVVHTLASKLTDSLYSILSIQEINEIKVSFHVFPEDWTDEGMDHPTTSTLKRVFGRELNRQKLSLGIKRLIDIIGSTVALLLCLPLFAVIAMAIKLTSKGPVLFKQVRLGQYGKKFTFLKFRSMYVNSHHGIHEDYIMAFMRDGAGAKDSEQNRPTVYKLTADPRVTAVGRFLRKASLDEIPQFLNVLKGEMSLVGPRPPVTYEFERYDRWHRQRLLAVKPGITGLWQVDGRSRVKFDDMVRLDIRYARSWSLWLDIKILLQTPKAVLSGDGAY
jgi:exopolysaccharide biosynthesis polyprenyl glycosylphosphotransferase